jgi:hypothetical protein
MLLALAHSANLQQPNSSTAHQPNRIFLIAVLQAVHMRENNGSVSVPARVEMMMWQ